MIHKFWNVRLASSTDHPEAVRQIEDTTSEAGRNAVRDAEEQMEEKVYKIWSVLSTFEESSAACISDMLLHVSNGAYVDGVLVAKKFIWHVDILFRSADKLDATMAKGGPKGTFSSSYFKILPLTSNRAVLFARSKVIMQKDRCILLLALENSRDGGKKAWRYTRASCSCHWSGPLPEAPNQDMSPRSPQGGTGAQEFRWSP